MLAGSLSARLACLVWAGAGVVLALPVLPDSELEPQADKARPTIAAPVVSVIAGERRRAIRDIPSTQVELHWTSASCHQGKDKAMMVTLL
jgi:hypothetical protein